MKHCFHLGIMLYISKHKTHTQQGDTIILLDAHRNREKSGSIPSIS